MRLFKPLSRRTFLLTVLVGVFSLIPAASVIAQQTPPGDLTVTVEEQENGDIKISLSGTAYMQGFSSGMGFTNFTDFPGNHPVKNPVKNPVENPVENPVKNPVKNPHPSHFPLPPGLSLTMPVNYISSESESPEEGALPSIVHALGYIYFSGGWYLGGFDSGSLNLGDTITGAGSVTTSGIDFNRYFVPGTFLVTPVQVGPKAVASVAEGEFSSQGIYPYFITYEVIPFVPNPSLALSHPGAFPKTILRKSGGTKKVTIRNNGNTPLTGLNLSISVPGDFSSSTLPKTALAPGESTSVDVTFRPKSRGKRTATLTVKGLHTPRQSEPKSALKRGTKPVEDFAPEPIEISASTSLSGEGKAKPRPKPRPEPPTESPRSVSRPR